MIGKLIVIFIFPMIAYFTIYPMLVQEINNTLTCNTTYAGNVTTLFSFLQQTSPNGQTESFGGAGGNYHFGGYNNELNHKSFVKPVYSTNSSILNPECREFTEDEKAVLTKLPIIFLIGTMLIGIFWARRMLFWGYDDIL